MNSSLTEGARPYRTLAMSACVGAVGMWCMLISSAAAQNTYGTLSNFDVFNDTGQECHGFEIELDGLSSAEVTFTFGAPYERYGNPKVVDFAGGVVVRYESAYDAANQKFDDATPMAPAVIAPTDGHACWINGSPNYLTAGCEHFGVGLMGNPTATAYRWLVADPSNPGMLLASTTKVSLPAPPVWSAAPPPQGGAPVVRAVVPAEPPEVQQQFGDAVWVKVYVTESPDPAELHHLVTDDARVPQDAAEVETEWAILQAGPGGANGELVNEGPVGANSKSVTRRYEFYQYTGAYDPESHEALCGGGGGGGGGGKGGVGAAGGGGGGSCSAPLPNEIGNYIGAQMAAINLDAVVLPPTFTPTMPSDTATPTASPTTAAATATATTPPPTVTAATPSNTTTPTNGPVTTTPTSGGITPTAPLPTMTAAPACVGNCNGDSAVTVDELIILVNIALQTAPPAACLQGVPAGTSVDIAMIIRAVNNLLGGCHS